MKSHLQIIYTKDMSREDWLAYRKTGVGASEVGAILGLSPYKSSIELFYEKIGQGLPYSVENIFSFMGLQHEDKIAEMWQYWEGSEESMIENFRLGRKVRKCRNINAYVRNPNFPWLFISMDRVINKTATMGEGALELKTISGYESDKWEVGIPPSHVVQVQTQTLVAELDFGELATMKDGRRFEVIPFDNAPVLQEQIVEQTHEFWKRVEKGKILATQIFEAERTFNMRLAQDLGAELATLEPAPDGSDAYNAFLKEKYHLATPGEIKGGDEQVNDALKHSEIKIHIKNKIEEAQLYENKLKRFMGNFDFIDLGTSGNVSWKANKNGIRSFRNNIKPK